MILASAQTKRETGTRYQGRAICVELGPHAVKVWTKGRRDAGLVPWQAIYEMAHTSADARIRPRRVGK